ncbi:MAG: hypothetical protein AAGC71_14870 [Pseudomonadota bacterium]
MLKTASALIVSALIGSGITVLLFSVKPVGLKSTPPVRDIAVQQRISAAAAEDLRADNYAAVDGIRTVMGLPSAFARREALHVLAGRADADAVQLLIYDAGRIENDAERRVALSILLQRLTDLDPPSALALIRSGAVDDAEYLEQTIWAVWAQQDFAAAVQTAASLPSAQRRFAAQSLYLASGLLGNDRTLAIEEALGIEPDRLIRTLYLFRLADRSVDAAIAYADATPPGYKQLQTVAWLAHYLVEQDPQNALAYTDRFTNAAIKRQYKASAQRMLAYADPKGVLADFDVNGARLWSQPKYSYAIAELAAMDLDAALAIFDSVADRQTKQEVGAVIVRAIAADDPDKALWWAQEQAQSIPNGDTLIFSALGTIAESDPQRAVETVLALASDTAQRRGIQTVFSTLSYRNPEAAAALLADLPDDTRRRDAERQLLQGWTQRDPAAAARWVMTLSDERFADVAEHSAYLFGQYPDVAKTVMPRLAPEKRSAVAQQVAKSIAMRDSPEAALDFVNRWADDTNRDAMTMQVIAGAAATDIVHAEQLAQQLPTVKARDMALVAVAAVKSEHDPWAGLAMAENIRTAQSRRQAITTSLARMAASDPTQVLDYLESMPTGDDRDSVITAMAGQLRDPGKREARLVASIKNDQTRRTAYGQLLMNVARRDMPRAERLLDDARLTSDEREQLRQMLHTVTRRY